MNSSKITRQTDGRIHGESDEWLENNLPNGWTDEELNGRRENNSPNGWTDGELYGRLEKELDSF